MHTSTFSYNLTRPYPFRWFTPVTIVGGIVGLVLFSTLNLAANGYDLRTVYTTDPNATLSQPYWFSKPPWSWSTRIKSTCATIGIPVGSQVFTSNLGISYSLAGVSGYDDRQKRNISYPSLPYLNQTLEDCLVDRVVLNMAKRDSSTSGTGAWWSWAAQEVAATVSCTVSVPDQKLRATFKSNYNPEVAGFASILQMNASTEASKWWGAWLLDKYWASILWSVYTLKFPGFPSGWSRMELTFKPNSSVHDIKNVNFLSVDHQQFLNDDGELAFFSSDLKQVINNKTAANYSQTVTQCMSWAKIMYSFVLVDFGQQSSQNLLLDSDLLQWFLKAPDDVFRNDPNNVLNCTTYDCLKTSIFSTDFNLIAAPDNPDQVDGRTIPINKAWDTLKDKVGPLGTKKTTIFSQYTCQVPRLKAPGAVVVTVVLADLIFLQACWMILQWTADLLVRRNDPSAMSCCGCVQQPRGMPLQNFGPAGRGYEVVYPNDSQEPIFSGQPYNPGLYEPPRRKAVATSTNAVLPIS